MKLCQVVGCLSVETKTLRSRLLPLTESVLHQLKTLLMDLARQKCTALLKDFSQHTEEIKTRPSTLEDFTDYMSLHSYHVGCKKAHLKAAVEVDDMYDLLFVNEQKISPADQVRYDDLKEAVANFIEELKHGKEFIADHKHTQIEKLHSNVQSINEDLVEIYKSLNKSPFIEAENTPKEVVGKLEGIMEDLEQIKTRIETLKSFQEMFDLPPEDFDGLERTQVTATTRLEIWNTLEVLSQKTETWLSESIIDSETNAVRFNFIAIQKEISTLSSIVLRLRKENKEDRVVFRLKDKVDALQNIQPVLEFAFRPSLSVEDWTKILLHLDRDNVFIDDTGSISKPFSVQDLLGLNIVEKLASIQSELEKDSFSTPPNKA